MNARKSILQILLSLVEVLPIALLLFLAVWQGTEKTKAQARIRQKVWSRTELMRKNDELKVGIVTYTSAERIEALYRKTYQYMPISASNRIHTVELPP